MLQSGVRTSWATTAAISPRAANCLRHTSASWVASSSESDCRSAASDCLSGVMSMSMPSTRAARAVRRFTVARFGKWSADSDSTTGPGWPPQMERISPAARAIALRVLPKSTPRSKRCDASLENPKLRALPATASGANQAASRKMSVVEACTPLPSPPMMPARPSTRASSAITSESASSASICPLSSSSDSPARA